MFTLFFQKKKKKIIIYYNNSFFKKQLINKNFLIIYDKRIFNNSCSDKEEFPEDILYITSLKSLLVFLLLLTTLKLIKYKNLY